MMCNTWKKEKEKEKKKKKEKEEKRRGRKEGRDVEERTNWFLLSHFL
jgi:hypothetical protein